MASFYKNMTNTEKICKRIGKKLKSELISFEGRFLHEPLNVSIHNYHV